MKLIIFFALSLYLLAGCDSPSERSELVGKWRVDRQLTVDSIIESKKMDNGTRTILIEDRTLGNLIMEFDDEQSRIMVVDSGEGYDFVDEFHDYEILEESADFFEIKGHDILHEKTTIKKFYREGNCFYDYYKARDFKEYFCKLDD